LSLGKKRGGGERKKSCDVGYEKKHAGVRGLFAFFFNIFSGYLFY
jgi:hypothetical protein